MKKTLFFLGLGLYAFVLSLTGFKEAWNLAFSGPGNEAWLKEILHNALEDPFTGLLAGVVITSLVQSSSATIALVVATVGSGVIDVSHSVFVLMGANIGTTITNTIVGLAYGKNDQEFKKVLPSILVDDLFKIFNVAIFFTIEYFTGFLHKASHFLVNPKFFSDSHGGLFSHFPDFLDTLTKPVSHLLLLPITTWLESSLIEALLAGLMFFGLLIFALNLMGHSLEELFKKRSQKIVQKAFSSKPRSILIGLGLCWFLQSSSVTVSLIIPLVSQGIVSLPHVYFYSLGAALGTTCDPGQLLSYIKFGPLGLKAGAVHILLNLIGVLLFSLVPGLNRLPIVAAQYLGDLFSGKKRGPLYLVLYALSVFILLPLGAIFI